VITQVYTAQTAVEAVELSRLGVDHVGVTVSERGLPSPYLAQVKVNADIHPKRYHIYTYSAQGAEAGDGSHEADAMTGG